VSKPAKQLGDLVNLPLMFLTRELLRAIFLVHRVPTNRCSSLVVEGSLCGGWLDVPISEWTTPSFETTRLPGVSLQDLREMV